MLDKLSIGLFVFLGVFVGGSTGLAGQLRYFRLHWSWALVAALAGFLLMLLWPWVGGTMVFICCLAASMGRRWHHRDIDDGGDRAQRAYNRLSPVEAVRNALDHRRIKRRAKTRGWIENGWLHIGLDEKHRPISIPAGGKSGSHTLILGATGSGKTVSEAWITGRMIEAGHAAVVIDPKGDKLLASECVHAAKKRGGRLWYWTPEGKLAYNPYAVGTDSEIADKALAGEAFSEPHYQRQAQRYLAQCVRGMRLAEIPITPITLAEHLDPGKLDTRIRRLDGAQRILEYLDGIDDRQRRELSGVRDRLSILAESDLRPWLDPTRDGVRELSLQHAVSNRDVVYFRLDADRRPLVSAMLAGAIMSDLIALISRQQHQPVPTAVVIDEFAAIAAREVTRLFARARSAGVSLVLATQELADLTAVGPWLRDQVLGNISALIAHRQNVPESAELIAQAAGTQEVWITTRQTGSETFVGSHDTGRGSRRRGHEFRLHPSEIKTLPTGWAAVITPGQSQDPKLARINHPEKAYQ